MEQNASIAQLTSALSAKKDAPEVGVARDARARAMCDACRGVMRSRASERACGCED